MNLKIKPFEFVCIWRLYGDLISSKDDETVYTLEPTIVTGPSNSGHDGGAIFNHPPHNGQPWTAFLDNTFQTNGRYSFFIFNCPHHFAN